MMAYTLTTHFLMETTNGPNGCLEMSTVPIREQFASQAEADERRASWITIRQIASARNSYHPDTRRELWTAENLAEYRRFHQELRNMCQRWPAFSTTSFLLFMITWSNSTCCNITEPVIQETPA